MGLFADASPPDRAPLADRLRPKTLDEFVGQESIVGPTGALRREIEADRPRSCILWGPPGSGKTTLARIVANLTGSAFVGTSAILVGVKEVRAIVDAARDRLQLDGRRTILFLDEIHRFNRAQQDVLLPHVEDGTVVLIGATTENPSFEVNAALLSRTTVYRLEALGREALGRLLDRALADDDDGFGGLGLVIDDDAREHLLRCADGDGRALLNAVEAAAHLAVGDPPRIDAATAAAATQQRQLLYDKAGDEHFNLISALHKSIRGSDPDAALYWLARMIEAGEDPLYVARRLIRIASEDVGLAAPPALSLAVAARDAYHMLGSPEGDLALAECAVYLALAPKSNAMETAWMAAQEDARRHGSLPVPPALRNAPTRLMEDMGYGAGYQYAHDHEDAFVTQRHLPEALGDRTYYHPTQRGGEAKLAAQLAAWRARRAEASG